MQAHSSNPTPQPQSYLGSFYNAHHFDINNSTFVDNSGNVRKLEELKVDLKNTVIQQATYDELSRKRRDQFDCLNIPDDIQEWIQNPHFSFKTSLFLKSVNKDILSLTGIPIVRFFCNNPTPGIRLAAHILFYDIPITEEGKIINSRRNVSHRWVTTLAYQLMLNIPELTIPMLEALHLDPRIPQYNSEQQIQKLIIYPMQSVISQGTDAPSMANDIAYLVEQLEALSGQPLKLLITGLPDYQVLSTFFKVPIQVFDLHWPRRVAKPQAQSALPPRSLYEKWSTLSVLQKKYCIEILLGAGTSQLEVSFL
ncbi:hypothetical protein BDQ17DRAFT_1545859 [Cyathus striatus]|nr:hypothetical protein BDQ17DRAFT_1545859 [Cyathus striatus]